MENALKEVQEKPETAGELLRKVRKYTRRRYTAEDKICIVDVSLRTSAAGDHLGIRNSFPSSNAFWGEA